MVVVEAKDPLVELNRYGQIQYTLAEYPRQVRIESSSFCNAGCSFCHAHGDFRPLDRKKGKMSWDLFERLIMDISLWDKPLEELVPTNYGELFLNRAWYGMLELTSQWLPKTGISLVTTGTMLTPDNIERLALIRTLSYVNFSINAYFTETWTRIHKLPEKLMSRAIRAVHAFRDRRPDVKTRVSMVYDPTLMTELEKDLFLTYWAAFGDVQINNASYTGNPEHKPNPLVTLPCRSVSDGLVIFDDGDVSMGCCFNGDNDQDLRIGHFPDKSLMDLWRGEPLANLMDIHNKGLRGSIKICAGCTFA